jgi:hypothetical protein
MRRCGRPAINKGCKKIKAATRELIAALTKIRKTVVASMTKWAKEIA